VVNLTRQGLPAGIIKKYGVTKKAWRIYRQKRPKTNKRRRVSNPKVKRVPRRRRYTRKRRRAKRTIPVLPIVGIVGGSIEPIKRAMDGDFEGAIKELAQITTGVSLDDGSWNPEWMKKFWIPVIVGVIGHKIANMLGINRTFANLPAPLNKLRL